MKKHLFIILFTFLFFQNSFAQDTSLTNIEQQLENLTDEDQSETEDDYLQQKLAYLRKVPLNLNEADENDLRDLRILTGLQIANFLNYRKLLGNFISIYELQAVPAWDLTLIKKLFSFITIYKPLNLKDDFSERLRGGDHILLFRYGQVLEKSVGYDYSTPGTKYLGGPQKLFFRYTYQYKNLLQFGFDGDKDAGEQFFKGAQNKGFDFYGFHFMARKIGAIRLLALGDFTVNMGQGLIQWQNLAFRKSVDVLGIKRQSPVLRAYNSAGEYNFHRGAGITLQKGKFEATVFASLRKLTANYVADTVSYEEYITSIINSGYHRTESEVENRQKLKQFAVGGNIKYRSSNWQLGINAIHYNFSSPIQERIEPYNKYAISGRNWDNFSIDYSYTFRNLHFFGEAAADIHLHKAFLNGLLISVDPRVDLSFIHRKISKEFQSINGNAFTENTYPTNENGLFAGISLRPLSAWRVDAYMDIFKFPWLKYLVDAPSSGKDFLAQVTFIPNKQVEVYSRYKSETKQSNQPDNISVTNFLVSPARQNWRTQLGYKISSSVTVRTRVDLLWYDNRGKNAEQGFLTFFDLLYNPVLKPFSANLRLQYFETDEYDSRMYAYENDVLYYYSIPPFYNKGFRYYFNINYNFSKKISLWVKWSQTIYKDQSTIGSGLDEISGSKKSEIRTLLRIIL